jgi:hypothetical protein
MQTARHLMKPFPNNPAFAHQNAANTWVRICRKPALLREPKSLR